MTRSAPSTADNRSTLSTPFWNVMRRLSGPSSGRAAAAAVSVSHSLTANSTMSTGPDLGGIVGDVWLRQMQVAVHALDLEAVLGDRIAMGAARDEEDIVARRGQRAPK